MCFSYKLCSRHLECRIDPQMDARCIHLGRNNRKKNENLATEHRMGRHVSENNRRTLVTSSHITVRTEQIHITFVRPVLPVPQTQVENGYTSVFSDASNQPIRPNKILLHCTKCQCEVTNIIATDDKILKLSLVPLGGRCCNGINEIYLFKPLRHVTAFSYTFQYTRIFLLQENKFEVGLT